MNDAKKYKATYCMTCRIGCRISERIWSMNIILQSHGETLSLDIETLQSHLMNFHQSSRTKVETGSGKQCVSSHFPKDPNCDICLKTKKERGLLAEDVFLQSCPERKFLVTWWPQITKFSVKKLNLVKIIDMPWWYKNWELSGFNPTHVKQKLPRRPKRA